MTNSKPNLIFNSDDREDLINAYHDHDTETIEAIIDPADDRYDAVMEALRVNNL